MITQTSRRLFSFFTGLALLAGVAGCSTAPQSSSAPGGSSVPNLQTSNLVTVPNIEGLGATEAEAVLKRAGLVAADTAIHGPMDNDAKDIGLAYRQNPRPGSKVAKGSKVSFRWWWEAG